MIFFRRWICVSIRRFVTELAEEGAAERFAFFIVVRVVAKLSVSLQAGYDTPTVHVTAMGVNYPQILDKTSSFAMVCKGTLAFIRIEPMKTLASLSAIVCLSIMPVAEKVWAETPDINSIRFTDAALAFASGSIQKTTPIDGIVNLITGDNQSNGNRMLLGKRDTLYLKLASPADATVGDLYTVYRRVRKVFHPVTKEYLGFVVNRSAVVKVTATDHALTTVEVVLNYGPVSPGDPVVRFVAPTPENAANSVSDRTQLEGMIIELQADRAMTLVSQSNVVYLDRGKEDGLQAGDTVDIYRHSAGLPPRAIGQLKVLSTESRTATARVTKANTRIIRGDRFRVTTHASTMPQPMAGLPGTEPNHGSVVVSPGPLNGKLTTRDALGQSRINLGDMPNFLHYDSGEAAVKAESYKALDQLIDYLRTSGDTRLVQIEGHTDNIEIGPSLKSRYASNMDLSKARANGVLRYLVEKGGLDTTRLTAVGYGDTKPAAPNDAEEGRTKNRRVEILLYGQEPDQAKQPDAPRQAQKPDTTPGSLNSRTPLDQSAASMAGADPSDSGGPGTLSTGNATSSSNKDGAGVPNVSDTGIPMQPDSGKQDSAAQPQPTAGSQGE